MIHSMTGYGKAEGLVNGKKITIEIRALNSKNLDLSVRSPQQFKEIELDIRKIVSNALIRGKVEVFINVSASTSSNTTINIPLAKQYYEAIKELSTEIGSLPQDYIAQILRMPDVMISDSSALSDEEKNQIFELTKQATHQHNEFRKQEGQSLMNDLTMNIEGIDKLLSEIPQYESSRIEIIKEKIKSNLEELGNKIDENRFEQELIYYIEKIDINEEKIRLANHLKYFLETMHSENLSVGKKLGFISQEIGREVNTLGSKSYDAQLQRLVVNMKDHLEKIKEQVLNTL